MVARSREACHLAQDEIVLQSIAFHRLVRYLVVGDILGVMRNGGQMGAWAFDPYYEWLGIQPSEQPADFYRLLGIAQFEDNAKVVERAADRQMGYVRQFQAKHPAEVSQMLSQLSLARLSLTDREKKRRYDATLRSGQAQVQPGLPGTPPEDSRGIWHFQLAGIPQGPFTTAELQVRIKAKEVREDTMVREGAGGRWMLAREARGLFDLSVSSPPAPGTGLPELSQLDPVGESADLLSGALPEPEDRTPGPNVWVCPGCRWPVRKPKTHCARCGYVKKVHESEVTDRRTMLILLLAAAAFVLFVLVSLLNE